MLLQAGALASRVTGRVSPVARFMIDSIAPESGAGVNQLSGGADFGEEALAAEDGARLRAKDLESDQPVGQRHAELPRKRQRSG